MPLALFRVMNIFTASMSDINPDQFMINRPTPSTQHKDNVESSRFAKLVNDAERSAPKHEDKPLSKPEPQKSDNEVKTVQSENRSESRKETEDTNKGQQISKDEHSKDDGGTDAKGTEEKTDKKQEVETTKSDLADNDVKGNVAEGTDNPDNEKVNDNIPVAEQVIASFEQALLSEITLPNQGEEQVAGTVSNTEEGSSFEVSKDTDTIKPKTGNVNHISNKGEASVKVETPVVDIKTNSVAASDKLQVNTAIDRIHINNESKEPVIDNALEKGTAGEMNSEDGQPEETGSDNKGSNKNTGFGKNNLDEIPEEFDLNEDLKEKIKLAATRELPDRYVKKIIIDKSDNKINQSQINVADPGVLEELNNVKTLQDGMLSGNAQSQAYNSGINNAIKGFSDTSLKPLESFHSNTAANNAELAQNQVMTMAGGKSGAGLLNGNAARTAAFSELLNQVVYVAKGKSKLGVTVNHDEFGKLKINVSMDKGMLNIHVNASDKVVREYLESNVQSIIESLSKDGVSVGGFSVALKDHKDNPEKKFLMDSGISRQYENVPTAAVHSNRGLVNVFA